MEENKRLLKELVEGFCKDRGLDISEDGQGTYFFTRADAPDIAVGVQAVEEVGTMLVQARLGALDQAGDVKTLRAMLHANVGLAAAEAPVFALNVDSNSIMAVKSIPLTMSDNTPMSVRAFGAIITQMAVDAATLKEGVRSGGLKTLEREDPEEELDEMVVFRG